MRKFILTALVALVCASSALATPGTPSGTITIDQPGPYAFQDTVTFTVTAQNLKGYQYPMVYVQCRSVVDNEVLYGQLAHPYETFVLGGGSSPWWTDTDDAHCSATLYAYEGLKRNAQITQLAAPILFDATR